MAGTYEVIRAATWVCCDLHGARPVMRADAGGDSGACFNADMKGGVEGRRVVVRHGWQIELMDALGSQSKTDESARVGRHEVYRLGRYVLGGDYQIAFVFPVFVVDEYDHSSLLKLFEYFGYFANHVLTSVRLGKAVPGK